MKVLVHSHLELDPLDQAQIEREAAALLQEGPEPQEGKEPNITRARQRALEEYITNYLNDPYDGRQKVVMAEILDET